MTLPQPFLREDGYMKEKLTRIITGDKNFKTLSAFFNSFPWRHDGVRDPQYWMDVIHNRIPWTKDDVIYICRIHKIDYDKYFDVKLEDVL